MKTKYISQSVAIKSAWMILEGLGYDRARNGDLEKTVAAVFASAPAADVVEVVRCRECKYSIMYKFSCNYKRVLACNDPHGVTIRAVKPMHFCSYGERKEGGQDDEAT